MTLALVTGAHGFIGKRLAAQLAQLGHRVIGVGHGIWPDAEAKAVGLSAWINGDVLPANLRLLQRQFGAPDHVFHLAGGSSVAAAIANPREDFFRTVTTTAELLEWLRLDAPAARLLVVSSAAVYGAGYAEPIAETAALRPYSPYGYNKRLMEELCASYAASYSSPSVIARLFSVYGPGLKKQLLWDACCKLAQGAEEIVLGGGGEEVRDWVHVDDAVCALVRLVSQASESLPVVNVATGIGTRVREIIEDIISAWSAGAVTPVRVRFTGAARVGDPFSLVADVARLRGMGIYTNRSLSGGIEEYVGWFRSAQGLHGSP